MTGEQPDELDEAGRVIFPFIKGSIFLCLAILSAVVFVAGLIKGTIYPIIMLVFFISASVVITGFVIVHRKQAFVIERLGAYMCTLEPGPHITIGGIDKVAHIISTKAKKLALFVGVDKIDFLDSAEESIDLGVYVEVINPEAAAYFTEELYTFIADTIETNVKKLLGIITVDEALKYKSLIEDGALCLINGEMPSELDELERTAELIELQEKLKKAHIRIRGEEEDIPKELLRKAGVKITSFYFNDVGLGEPTKEIRKKVQEIRRDKIVADGEREVEKAKIEVEKQLAEQVRIKESGIGAGRRKRWNEMKAGGDGTLTDKGNQEWERDMMKYGKGVDNVSEINIKGGDGSTKSTAAAGAILGKTFAEASEGKTGPKKEKEE